LKTLIKGGILKIEKRCKMENKYKQMGKEFGYSHKGSYWFEILLVGFLSFSATMILGLLVGFESTLVSFISSLISVATVVPVARYNLDLIADPKEDSGVRLSNSFNRLNSNTIVATFITNLIVSLPYIVCVFIGMIGMIFVFEGWSSSFGLFPWIMIILIGLLYTVKVSLDYYLVSYILAINPNENGSTARTTSKEMMKGYKGDLVLLQLSFIPFYILSIFLILPIIWLVPYYISTMTYFVLERLDHAGYIDYETKNETEEYEEAEKVEEDLEVEEVEEVEEVVEEGIESEVKTKKDSDYFKQETKSDAEFR
jgi:uncharacterized membrane protein